MAVLDKEAPSADRWREVYFALAEVFRGYALDLVFLNTADPLFRFEIMRHGLLLYGDRTLFDSYRIFAYRDFVASEDLRRLEGILFRKKMAFLHRCLHDQ
ncbi:MAG: hypothetical protein KatS3mg131_1952 [Candidatus Tectimicrobiota bacterium]|nr:MAG: hypothetical protein KatS3mg131_1952 [Candidatus Tectomicrobia bacterium]